VWSGTNNKATKGLRGLDSTWLNEAMAVLDVFVQELRAKLGFHGLQGSLSKDALCLFILYSDAVEFVYNPSCKGSFLYIL
jgi:hypothetical protein